MIQLTNGTSQTVEPGGVVVYDATAIKTGCGECHRSGSGSVAMRNFGTYEIAFSGNLGGVAAGDASLAVMLDGEPIGTMSVVTAAAGDLQNVSYVTAVRNCCDGSRVTIENNGAVAVTVTAPSLLVRRIG
jgi:hypothetical protein